MLTATVLPLPAQFHTEQPGTALMNSGNDLSSARTYMIPLQTIALVSIASDKRLQAVSDKR